MAGRGGLRKLKDTPACPCPIKKGAPAGGAFFPAECRSTDGILACPDRTPCSTDGILRFAQDDRYGGEYRSAQDDSTSVILRNAVTKNPGRRRTRSGRMPFYGRDPSLSLRMTGMGENTRALRMTLIFLSFWGKCATAAGGGKRERVCGGEAEL